MGGAMTRPGDYTRGADSVASRFSISRFGGPTTYRTSTVSVGITATRIVGNNPRRVQFTIYNRSVNSIDLDYVSSVTANGGIPLSASSGVATSTIEDDGETVVGEIYGIASSPSSSVFVVEVLRV